MKQELINHLRALGADLIGFSSVRRWEERNEVPADFRPQSIWPLARTVIVLGLQMPLPMVDTTPSVLHMELYRTANQELDGLAYKTVRYLNSRGYPSIFFTRDGYGSMRALRENPRAAFSHVVAAVYAGLGTVGANNVLLTKEFGPRVRLISVFTSLEVEPDPMQEKDLCIKCGFCVKCCPANALTMREDRVLGDYDKMACLSHSEELVRQRIYPCGVCTKVCPVGKDRELYQEKTLGKKYLEEKEALAANPDDPRYRSWNHIRRYGRAPKIER
ncbi:MAG: epoxyqueuosine reductase [Firmicutes bacterium]|nr:epoxyqueuosine reductase [Bacillota bacterium]